MTPHRIRYRTLAFAGSVFALLSFAVASPAGTLQATYLFQDTLAAEEPGRPSLFAVNPLGMNGFETATVFGSPRRVYRWDGNAFPLTQQAGLFVITTGVIPTNNYSVEMVFEFTEKIGSWRRIIDVENRQADDGFYVSPDNVLQIWDAGALADGPTEFTTSAFHHVVLTNSGGIVQAFLDGNLELTATTGVMDINNPLNVMNFFLDNVVGAGLEEFADGRVALIRLYAGALTPAEVALLARDPFPAGGAVPEPSALALLCLGVLGVAGYCRRRR
jgi:hypothetical protein